MAVAEFPFCYSAVGNLEESAKLWQVPLWLTNTVLNIPLFLAAFRMMGWQFIGRTLYSTAMLSAALYVLPEMGLVKEDMILSALFGGVL